MSKANREKRQTHLDSFPFKLLHAWIRPYVAAGKVCKCNSPVAYVFEHYIDSIKMQLLINAGTPEAEAIDNVWDQSVREQRRGRYRRYHSSYLCRECTHAALEGYVGSNGAVLALMPGMIVGERATVLAGVTLQSINDEGKSFAACAVAYSIEEVARQLRSEEFAINLK
jgi:hypothetical protein